MVNDNEDAMGTAFGQLANAHVNKFGMAVSVGLLVSGLAWIVVNGQWLELLLPLVAFMGAAPLGGSRRLYWKGFDPTLIRAAQGGNLVGYLFWTLLTWVLDWLIDGMVCLIGLWLFLLLAKGDVASSPWAMTWAVGAALAPPFLFVETRRQTGPYVYWPPLRLIGVLPWMFVPLACFHPVTLSLLAVVLVAFTPFDLCWRTAKLLKTELWTYRSRRVEHLRTHGETVPLAAPRANHRCWRPRPGILFEMPYNSYFGFSEAQWNEWVQPHLTIRTINAWGVALSAAALSFGCWGCVHTGHPHWLWAILVGCIVSSFFHGVAEQTDENAPANAHDPDLQLRRVCCMGILQLLAAVAMGGVLVWLLTPSWLAMGALCVLLAAAWNLPHAFLSLASDATERDPLELCVFALALGVTAAAMLCLERFWLFALLPGIFILFYPWLRWHCPRSGLRGEARLARIREEERLERSDLAQSRGESPKSVGTVYDTLGMLGEKLHSLGMVSVLTALACLAAAWLVAFFGGTERLLWAPLLLAAASTILMLMMVFESTIFADIREPERVPKVFRMLCGKTGQRRFGWIANFLFAMLMPTVGFIIVAWVDPTCSFSVQALLVLFCMVLLPLSYLRRPSGVVVFGSLGGVALWALSRALGQGACAEASLIVSPVIAAVVHHFRTRKRAVAGEQEDCDVPPSPEPSVPEASNPSPSSRRPYRSRPSRRR